MTVFAELVMYMTIFAGVCSVVVWYFMYRFQKNINARNSAQH